MDMMLFCRQDSVPRPHVLASSLLFCMRGAVVVQRQTLSSLYFVYGWLAIRFDEKLNMIPIRDLLFLLVSTSSGVGGEDATICSREKRIGELVPDAAVSV